MKRTKTGSQPTRIMPRRGKTRQNDVSSADAGDNTERNLPLEDNSQKTRRRIVAETSTRSESELVSEASASVRGGSRRKRTKLDTENSTDSKPLPASEALAPTDSRSNRKSPELSCSICLCSVENRAFTDACYHTFCFECLVEWSNVRAVCPLCKKPFHSIIHSFRSYDDYKLYQVPKSYVSNSRNVSSPNNSASSNFARVGRLVNGSNSATLPLVNASDHMLALRRRVYSHSEDMQLCGLWSSDGVVIPSHHISPAMFDCYPVMLERVRPWVLRDVAVITGNGDVAGVADIVLGLLRNFPITSEDFYERLFPYLGLHTRRFLQELEAFARSPFDMTTYDARVVYSTGANVESFRPLPTEHVEDISSSDDSDIEIVSPAVVTTSEPAQNSSVGLGPDPDLLYCLQAFQHNLMMSFSLMNHQSYNSGLDSPVPGPSGLGQAIVTDESDSIGSHASRSVYDGEERSNSPMVLSDADSDIVLVDVNRSVRSPIHISSGEDDSVTLQRRPRSRRRVKRRRRLAQEHGSDTEQGDNPTVAAERAVKNKIPQADITLPHSEPLADRPENCNVEELVCAADQNESSSKIQSQSSVHDNDIKMSDHSSASVIVSPSKSGLQAEVGKTADTMNRSFKHAHPKRSRSANSVANMSVMSSADDVNPLPCKKHVRGHKSSKQKAREDVADKSSGDVVCDSSEKLTGDQVGTTVGSRDLSDTDGNKPASADVLNKSMVASTGESSIACEGLSSNPLPEIFLLDTVSGEEKLAAVCQLDCEVPVPFSSENCPLPAAVSLGSGLEDTNCTSCSAEAACDTESESFPEANGNLLQCGDCACDSSCSVVRIHSVEDTDEHTASVVKNGDNVNSCDHKTRTDLLLSSACVQSDNVDMVDSPTKPPHVWSSYADTVMTIRQSPSPDLLSLPNPSPTQESNNCNSEASCSVSISAANSTSSTSHIQIHSVRTCKWEDQDVNRGDCQLLPHDSNHSLPVAWQEDESSNSSRHRDSQFLPSAICGDSASSNDQSSLPADNVHSTVSKIVSATCQLTDQFQSPTSPRVVTDENQASLAYLDQDIIVGSAIGSPVGIESSDSEVEWLETDGFGRQRCISISSGGSSSVCSLSDTDDIETLLSDTDGLEICDDEPQTSRLESQTVESRYLYQTCPSSPGTSALLPPTSDMTSSVDVRETEPAVVCEEIILEPQTSQLEDHTAESRHLSLIYPLSPQNSALLPSLSDVASSLEVNETEPAEVSDKVTLEPQTSQLEDQIATSRDSYQTCPLLPQNSALLPSSSDMASSLKVDETEPAATSEQVNLEQRSQSCVSGADIATNTTDLYSDDVTPESNPVPNA